MSCERAQRFALNNKEDGVTINRDGKDPGMGLGEEPAWGKDHEFRLRHVEFPFCGRGKIAWGRALSDTKEGTKDVSLAGTKMDLAGDEIGRKHGVVRGVRVEGCLS